MARCRRSVTVSDAGRKRCIAASMRAWTVPIQATKSIVLFGTWEGLQSVGFEYLHLLLCLGELGLAVLREFQAAFVRGEGLLQRELSRFHRRDELFQFGQRGFEA